MKILSSLYSNITSLYFHNNLLTWELLHSLDSCLILCIDRKDTFFEPVDDVLVSLTEVSSSVYPKAWRWDETRDASHTSQWIQPDLIRIQGTYCTVWLLYLMTRENEGVFFIRNNCTRISLTPSLFFSNHEWDIITIL